jgi:hypothetical protein
VTVEFSDLVCIAQLRDVRERKRDV